MSMHITHEYTLRHVSDFKIQNTMKIKLKGLHMYMYRIIEPNNILLN